MVRLWINDKDYGTMSEEAAESYLEIHRTLYPDEPYRVEPVSDDAETFLP